MTRHPGVVLGVLFLAHAAAAQFTQQGSKLVGTDAVGDAQQGTLVAISADGNTAIVGGYADGSGAGAAWVYTRSGGAWSQQGRKLVGGGTFQGTSVAMSADGNTAIVGGPNTNPFTGLDPTPSAAWVYTRSNGAWSEQGGPLVGVDAVGGNWRRCSVGIAADGNTVIVGGDGDNSSVGAAWVFTRSGGVWSQQGNKLVGADYTGGTWGSWQGTSVAISADGITAFVGGPNDAVFAGATWVYTRSAGVWSQKGSKLVGAGAAGPGHQGGSVAISADGTTVIVGGPGDNSYAGAAWVFSASAFTIWVPVASHNPGKNNSQWRSDLGLLNTGTVAANVQIKFFGSGGVVSNTTYVSPRVQSILTDVVGQVGGIGSGALEIVSDQPLKVTARSYNQVSSTAICYAGGTQGQDYPALVTSNGLAATQSAYLPGLSESSTYRCNIGVVNTGTGSATVLVELFDGAGTKLTEYPLALNPGDLKQETQPFFGKAGQTAMDRGYAKITVQTGSGVFGFASVVDGMTNDPTTVTM